MQYDCVRAPSNAPAQLVKLRQPKGFRIFDEHHRGVRNIHADLDERSREQCVHPAGAKFRHHRVFFAAFSTARAAARRENGASRVFKFSNSFVTAFKPFLLDSSTADKPHKPVAPAASFSRMNSQTWVIVGCADECFDLAAATGQFVNHRNIEIAVKREAERARNRPWRSSRANADNGLCAPSCSRWATPNLCCSSMITGRDSADQNRT